MKATIHLIIGSTGAGKSTYARNLATESGLVRFAIDEWMTTLFGADKPADAGFHWYRERIERATNKIWSLTTQLVRVGTGSVLEIGLTQRADREAFYQRVRDAEANFQLHVLEAPREVRWERVSARNRLQGETFSLEVTRGMFDFVEDMWEPPDSTEMAEWSGKLIENHTDSHGGPGQDSESA